MKIPDTPAAQTEALRRYVAECEKAGARVFRPTDFGINTPDGPNLEEAHFGQLLGVAGEYDFYMQANGYCIVTWKGYGPWPYASITWVLSQWPSYTEAILRVAAESAKASGEDREEFTRLMLAVSAGWDS